uniref:Adenosine kinase n=1 Tax=Globodera rostochiensis TaxID=31243 RepID=A0A914HUI6_GLORO
MAILVGLGSPLLDITANVGTEFLEKYGLEENGAVLIDEENKGTFMPIFNEVLALDSVTLLPGGSALNTIRVFQWVLNGINGTNKNERATFFGSVGMGPIVRFVRASPAADKFTLDFLYLPENAELIEASKCFYSAAFFLAVCPEAVLHLAMTAAKLERPFLFNLSAEYIAGRYKKELNEILPFVDVLFANDGEAIAYAPTNGFKSTCDLHKIALDLTRIEKAREGLGRIVLITRGDRPLIVAQNGITKEFPVILVEKMVDTNGAGDAFCGGFLAAFACGFPMEKCIKYALSSAATIVQQKGCTFPEAWELSASD